MKDRVDTYLQELLDEEAKTPEFQARKMSLRLLKKGVWLSVAGVPLVAAARYFYYLGETSGTNYELLTLVAGACFGASLALIHASRVIGDWKWKQ